ncbi:methionine adenosyltransferase [Citroniella saccharovorans]|uniref:S-adenosylmethionine synthase n=1 Tax=Citroniella saccharovorans TaxID=2053367 RepID=A0AAW9MWI4_9FIRM|nr:methionine adenosyltransferase [Citroniella saccharovorans]MEB3429969.1 methionine adenosyltransferase [Citroniella saccharovorans]
MTRYFFTSESVTEGHPDKICDQISDAILDELLRKDKNARVACETTVSTGLVMVMGEISTSAYVDIQNIVRNTVREIGYTRAKYGFDAETCSVLTAINEQSQDIALGVDKSFEAKSGASDRYDEIGAGDQGIIFGYASNQTDEYLPLPIYLAHKLTKGLTKLRKDEVLNYLRPDGKSQVTVEYDNYKPVRVDSVVVSTQHSPEIDTESLRSDIKEKLIKKIIPENLIDENTKYYINPTGRFEIGGPMGDSGLTGRKIIVDTYGGFARNGGGAFSGKDPTKVDRSAAYAARYAAKNMVAAGLSEELEIGLSYAIGVARPLSIYAESFGTSKFTNEELVKIIEENFDLRPLAIIEKFDLKRPIYKQTAAYGHFGRSDLDLPWEKLDKVEDLKKYLK